ncbi:hypothetical protein [Morganella morganii]|uniref:hypothetical protein n=1 Tax=Morganella morganii TaxID=582 RepID=UPI00197C4930|nr:hypothetical protein [Morganella morganii]MBN4020355.1 hypothetical protein [Morganella morganii]
MQTEPIITTNSMSVDEVAAWITEKAQALQKLQSLRAERDREIRDPNALSVDSMKISSSGKSAVL